MEVEVVRSARRRKTVHARLVDGVLHVAIPSWMSKAEEARHVANMVGRFERRTATEAIDLAARAEVLAARHGLPHPSSIKWVDNQESQWGSCTPAHSTIRISSRLAAYPSWVVDYVVVHELAHLVEAGHGAAFWELVNRYPKTERARGYLIAKSVDGDDDCEGSPEPVRPPGPEVRHEQELAPAPRRRAHRSRHAPAAAGEGALTLW